MAHPTSTRISARLKCVQDHRSRVDVGRLGDFSSDHDVPVWIDQWGLTASAVGGDAVQHQYMQANTPGSRLVIPNPGNCCKKQVK